MSITLEKLRALKREAGGQAASATRREPVAVSSDQSAQTTAGIPATANDANAEAHDARTRTHADHATYMSLPQPVDPRGLTTRVAAPSQDTTVPVIRTPAPGAQITSLRRMLGLRERPLSPPPPRRAVDRRLPGDEIAPGLHYVEVHLPVDVPRAGLSLAFARRDTHVDPRHLLFFDTETTGLAGGTGTRAFMIGAADWQGDALRIRQLLIANMAAEAAMLREFATWLAPHTVLSSYNGRSYDAPLLKTRYRLARLPDPLHALDHVDLLHPTRRRYRGRWENCKLATIERELLRVVREDDLPGSQAPAAWLGFLRGGSSALLHRVLAHNHQDVVTLAGLMLRLVEAEAAERASRP